MLFVVVVVLGSMGGLASVGVWGGGVFVICGYDLSFTLLFFICRLILPKYYQSLWGCCFFFLFLFFLMVQNLLDFTHLFS